MRQSYCLRKIYLKCGVWEHKDRVDIVLINPPFGGWEEDGIEANLPIDIRADPAPSVRSP